jgi:hypothetical protein
MFIHEHTQNAGQSHNTKMGNKSYKSVAKFEYFGRTTMNQNWIHEEIMGRLELQNTCCHLVENISSISSLSKNINTKISRTIILYVVLNGCETRSLELREEH